MKGPQEAYTEMGRDTVASMEENNLPRTQPRAYQLEMFEESMKGNIIAAMPTGSGKTQIAKLRIEAELERCAVEKLVWFLAPNIVLAGQQHQYLSHQLPAYSSRLICGSDNADRWNSAIWLAILKDIRIVVSTPQVLFEALEHGFVRMGVIALLVFDEAHHCVRKSPMNRVMANFYHLIPVAERPRRAPHILGLTASPITNQKLGALEALEQNLDAVCKTPKRHLEELETFVHKPEIKKIIFGAGPFPWPEELLKLCQAFKDFDISQDPWFRHLEKDGASNSQERLQEVREKNSTYTRDQLGTLFKTASKLNLQLGAWASVYFLRLCSEKVGEKIQQHQLRGFLSTLEVEEQVFLSRILSSILDGSSDHLRTEIEGCSISPKVASLLDWLGSASREGLRGIIFVQERITASILAKMISQHSITKDAFVAEPFVGASDFARKATMLDYADIKAQNAALAGFRAGENNLMVSTSVMEEGVDIPAVNLVVRFDEPANFRAFIQSMGRARQAESIFLFMNEEGDPTGSEQAWAALEREMKEKYMDDMRQIAKRKEGEQDSEDYDEFICNAATGARLSIHDAKQHLEHFCSCLPTVLYADPPRPEYILVASEVCHYQADVVLPQAISINPRRIRGAKSWNSEKMARKDAAFQAYDQLYKNGLINDNLLPADLPDPVVLEIDADNHDEESVICVENRLHPWTHPHGILPQIGAHTVTFQHDLDNEESYPQLHIFFPWASTLSMSFHLAWNVEQSIHVNIEPVLPPDGIRLNHELRRLGTLSTTLLFESMYLGNMGKAKNDSGGLPLLMMPFLDCGALQSWVEECAGETSSLDFDTIPLDAGLIRLQNWPRTVRPYIGLSKVYQAREKPPGNFDSMNASFPVTEELHLHVKRMPKRLDYLQATTSRNFSTAVEVIPAADYRIDHFPPKYAKVMLLIPSILHEIEIRKVAMSLTEDLLAPIGFVNIGLVEQAICASAAKGQKNYQRLELIGDSVLKFWTSAGLCARFPSWHEGYLSRGKDRVVSNLHLSWAARKLGLPKYICTEPFAGCRWRPPSIKPRTDNAADVEGRPISRKVLADVVEALIGASFLDGQSEEDYTSKVKASLTILLSDVPWNSPAENASTLRNLVPREAPAFPALDQLTAITGYAFEKRLLLCEALTHPSHLPVGVQATYQRLEFLGDSILDFIVVQEMANHSREIPHSTMHLIRSAVVNAHLLAFYCMGSSVQLNGVEPIKNKLGHYEITTETKRKYLWQFMSRSSNPELFKAQETSTQRFEKFGPQIAAALENGSSHPWCLLLSLRAEKFFSDIIESILGAIFVDSEGSLQKCKDFLEKLGLLRYLRHVMEENLDVMHPKERLGINAGNSKLRYETTRQMVEDAAEYSSTVFIEDEPRAASHGETSKAAAEAKAAEIANASYLERRDEQRMEEDNGL